MHGRGCTSRQSSPAVLGSLALSSLLVLRTQVGEVVYHWNNDKTCTLHSSVSADIVLASFMERMMWRVQVLSLFR